MHLLCDCVEMSNSTFSKRITQPQQSDAAASSKSTDNPQGQNNKTWITHKPSCNPPAEPKGNRRQFGIITSKLTNFWKACYVKGFWCTTDGVACCQSTRQTVWDNMTCYLIMHSCNGPHGQGLKLYFLLNVLLIVFRRVSEC